MPSQISIWLLSIPAVLLTLMIHEISHGYMAYALGDPTAKNLGRLTLNPLRHLDPIGTLCMILFRFGWAKPVPINSRNFEKPRRDIALTALAGPLSNFLFAFLLVPAYLALLHPLYAMADNGTLETPVGRILLYFYYFLTILHSLNIGLGLFNLIPLPPLDGSRILSLLLPPRYYYRLMQYERYIAFGLMIFIILGGSFGFLSLLSGFLSGAMESVWRLIPYFRI